MLFFILVAIAHANELHYLGLKNYSMIKKENSPIVIFYYGEDRNSKKFLPEFLLIADKKHELVNQSTTFPETLNYGIVNQKEEGKLMEKTQISDKPAMFLFYGESSKIKYNGAWNGQSFVNWIKKIFRDTPELNEFHPSSQIHKFQQLQTKFGSFNLIAILVTPDYRLAPLKSFVAAAKQAPEGYVFCHVHDPEMAKALGVEKEQSKLIVYSRIEDMEFEDEEASKKWKTYLIPFDGDVKNTNEILQFLQIYSWKGFFYADDTKFQKLTWRKDLLPSIILLYNKTIPEHAQRVEEVKNYRHSLLRKAVLGVSDVNSVSERMNRLFGINCSSETEIPTYIMVKPKNDKEFFKYQGDFKDPLEFYEQWQESIIYKMKQRSEGKLTPFYKDQGELPESELYDAVGLLKLTRTTYYPFIEEKNKNGIDVVVMYTAKECAPCKQFKPDYNSVHKKFKDVTENKVIFTRVNVDLNELDNIHIDNYPHIKLYKAGLDHPLTLHDQKSEEGLIAWLRKNSNYGELFGHQEL